MCVWWGGVVVLEVLVFSLKVGVFVGVGVLVGLVGVGVCGGGKGGCGLGGGGEVEDVAAV